MEEPVLLECLVCGSILVREDYPHVGGVCRVDALNNLPRGGGGANGVEAAGDTVAICSPLVKSWYWHNGGENTKIRPYPNGPIARAKEILPIKGDI
jgi:hypothetical protein